MMSAATVLPRHPQYYLPDGSVILEADGELYRVHRYFLERESEVFRAMFAFPPGAGTPDGQTDDTPIALPDTTKAEMEALFGFLYRGMFPREVGTEEWLALLAVSSRYMCDAIRAVCMARIQAPDSGVSAVQRLVLARRYDLHGWERPALVELCTRAEPLSMEEAGELGVEVSLKVMRARERGTERALGEAALEILPRCGADYKGSETAVGGEYHWTCQCCRSWYQSLADGLGQRKEPTEEELKA